MNEMSLRVWLYFTRLLLLAILTANQNYIFRASHFDHEETIIDFPESNYFFL